MLRFALANGRIALGQPRGLRDYYVVARRIGECSPIRCKCDVVNGTVGVVGKLARQRSSSDIPKTNRERRRINGTAADYIHTVRSPGKVALTITENFVTERKAAVETPIGDTPHFDCVYRVGAGCEELSIW